MKVYTIAHNIKSNPNEISHFIEIHLFEYFSCFSFTFVWRSPIVLDLVTIVICIYFNYALISLKKNSNILAQHIQFPSWSCRNYNVYVYCFHMISTQSRMLKCVTRMFSFLFYFFPYKYVQLVLKSIELRIFASLSIERPI